MKNYDAAVAEYLKHLRRRGRAEKTITGYRYLLNEFKKYLLQNGVRDIGELNKDILQQYILQLVENLVSVGEKRKRKSGYVRGKLLKLRLFFQYLGEQKENPVNPCDQLDLPRPGLSLSGATLSRADMIRLLNTPDLSTPGGIRDQAILELLYSSGLRQTEMRILMVGDVDLSRGMLLLRSGKVDRERSIPFTRAAGVAIDRYLREERARVVVDAGIDNLFLSFWGKPLQDAIGAALPRQARRAGLKQKVNWNTLRRTCARHLLDGGAEDRYIKELLSPGRPYVVAGTVRIEPEELRRVHRKCHPRSTF